MSQDITHQPLTFDVFCDWLRERFQHEHSKQGLVIPLKVNIEAPKGLPAKFAVIGASVDRASWSWVLGQGRTIGKLYFTFETVSAEYDEDEQDKGETEGDEGLYDEEVDE